MNTTQVVGPYINNNEIIIQTSQNYTLDKDHAVVIATAPGVTLDLTLPPNPEIGEIHRIVATSDLVFVSPGLANVTVGATVVAGPATVTVPAGTIGQFVWSGLPAYGWITTCCVRAPGPG